MGQGDDDVGAGRLEGIGLGLRNRNQVAAKDDIGARAAQQRRVGRGKPKNADLFAAGQGGDRAIAQFAISRRRTGNLERGQRRRGARLEADIGAQHRELGAGNEVRQHLVALVELVVADRNGVIAEPIIKVKIGLALVEIEVERSLEDVAGIEEEDVLAGIVGLDLIKKCLAACHTTEVTGRGRITAADGQADRLDTGVMVVRVYHAHGIVDRGGIGQHNPVAAVGVLVEHCTSAERHHPLEETTSIHRRHG